VHGAGQRVTIAPWKPATVAPPRHLPMTIELRRTGATIISRRKPNSRSQTIDGFRPRQLVEPDAEHERNSSGCTSDVMIRRRSLRKRTSSRCQTILIARSSLRQERRGTLTRMTSATALIAGRPRSSPAS
jgi:hypothetical protein